MSRASGLVAPDVDLGETIWTGVVAGVLIVVLGLIAWVSGGSFLFPSLGPSAYLLATRPEGPNNRPKPVVGGHAIGVVVGFVAYATLGNGLVVTGTVPPFGISEFHLIASAVLSVVGTTVLMLFTDLRHAPACATTLIVSLGLMSTPADGAVIVFAICCLVAVQRTLLRLDLIPGVSDVLSPGDSDS